MSLSFPSSGADAGDRAHSPVPDKTVVLTFDDNVRSHLTFVAPLLKEYGFGATFFVTHKWMDDPENFLSWEEVAELHQMGFEIGNHTWTHSGFSSPKAAARLEGELALVENELRKVGVPRPVTFAWPGNGFGPESLQVLQRLGFRFARRGKRPEVQHDVLEPGPAYDIGKHHPLLIPSTGNAFPEWNIDHFVRVVEKAKDGEIAVLQFHGVPDPVHPWVHTPPDNFRDYMLHLKENGFHVIALRDLARFAAADFSVSDPIAQTRFPKPEDREPALPQEMIAARANPKFWLENMLVHHGYSWKEAAPVFGWSEPELKERALKSSFSPSATASSGKSEKVTALPYPGGRHPRIGFLDGAIDPQRGTKISLFPPWEDGGYVVLDLPEAIFSNLGLTFLAHTHIPTIWDDENIWIENVDWTIQPDGNLEFERALPNGVRFGSKVSPDETGADLELWLHNGTHSRLTEMRTQICAMLRGASGFNHQTNDRKIFEKPVAVVGDREGSRWILVAFERCGRSWGNPPCPCIHADPHLPDADPGETVRVRGRLWFYQGKDIDKQIAEAQKEFSTL